LRWVLYFFNSEVVFLPEYKQIGQIRIKLAQEFGSVLPVISVSVVTTKTLTLCRSYLNRYCLGRKAAFFSVGI
jgi:hypothetical protein